MPDIAICLHAHQPYRLQRFRVFDIARGADYFDDELDRLIVQRVAARCYVPASRLLRELIGESNHGFAVALSVSGVLLDQLAHYAPEALASLQALAASGGVELLGGTYYESLSAVADPDEFAAQVRLQLEATERWFRQRPTVFRNTGLIYSDAAGQRIAGTGLSATIIEGAPGALGGRSPNRVYGSAKGLKLLPRNYRLSEDIAHRFLAGGRGGSPLRADTVAEWIAASDGESILLDLDLETFGEHYSRETGIFEFLRHLPEALARRGCSTIKPSTLAARPPADSLTVPKPVSASGDERDLSGLLGNRLQQAAAARLYGLRSAMFATNEPHLIEHWRRLSSGDHFFYLQTKWLSGGGTSDLSPYEDPYTAFINYMNVLEDLERKARAVGASRQPRELPARKRPSGLARRPLTVRQTDARVKVR